MARAALFSFLLFAAGAFAAPALAAPTLSVPLDQARAVPLRGAAAGVVVGNPSIAGVSIQNERLLFVTGRSYGSTNLIVVGANGRPIYEGRVSVVADEADVVMVTRGVKTFRHDCAPICRRKPDISDDPDDFKNMTDQIDSRVNTAGSTK